MYSFEMKIRPRSEYRGRNDSWMITFRISKFKEPQLVDSKFPSSTKIDENEYNK